LLIQTRSAFCKHQSSSILIEFSSSLMSFSATPWSRLWLFLVMRKTSGFGLGTYLMMCQKRKAALSGSDLPLAVDVNKAKETDQSVSHQCDATSLGRAVEECDLRLVRLQRCGILHARVPRVWMHTVLEHLASGNVSFASTVDANHIAVIQLQTGLVTRAEIPTIP
jgi:hypothetical protein